MPRQHKRFVRLVEVLRPLAAGGRRPPVAVSVERDELVTWEPWAPVV